MNTEPTTQLPASPPLSSSDLFCGCPQFIAAQQAGTDNEMYGALLYSDADGWAMGCDLPPISYCPWCGKPVPQNALLSDRRGAGSLEQIVGHSKNGQT